MVTRHGLEDNGKSRSTAVKESVSFATWWRKADRVPGQSPVRGSGRKIQDRARPKLPDAKYSVSQLRWDIFPSSQRRGGRDLNKISRSLL